MLHRRANKINRFHERCLRIIYNGKTSTFKKQVENGVNSCFKIYSTEPSILNDPDFSNKLKEIIVNDLIEALKSKLLDEFMPYMKVFIKEELRFRKQENDLVNSNTEIIKSLEKEL